MKQNKKYCLILISTVLIFTVSETLVSGSNTNFRLEYLNNKLSVNAEKAPLGSLLAKIQDKTGIIFLLNKEEADRIISVGFQALPIDKAIQRILNNLNHAVIFGPDYNIQKVIIVGKSKMSLTSHVHEHNMSSSSTAMIIESPVQEGMKITHPPDAMVIGPPSGEDMKITHGGEEMKITHDGEEMKITHDGEEMKITHDGEEMKITRP